MKTKVSNISKMLPFQQRQTEFTQWLRDPEKNTPPTGLDPTRLQLYHEVLFENISSFIHMTFPIARQLIPQKKWQRAIQDFFTYGRATSPYFYDISAQFRDYLIQHTHPITVRYPWLNELLHYEWLELYLEMQPTPQNPKRMCPHHAQLLSQKKFQQQLNHSVVFMIRAIIQKNFQQKEPLNLSNPDTSAVIHTDNSHLIRYQLKKVTPYWVLAYTYPVFNWTTQTTRADCLKTETPTCLLIWKNKQDELAQLTISSLDAYFLEQLQQHKPRFCAVNFYETLLDTLPPALETIDKTILLRSWLNLLLMLHQHKLVIAYSVNTD